MIYLLWEPFFLWHHLLPGKLLMRCSSEQPSPFPQLYSRFLLLLFYNLKWWTQDLNRFSVLSFKVCLELSLLFRLPLLKQVRRDITTDSIISAGLFQWGWSSVNDFCGCGLVASLIGINSFFWLFITWRLFPQKKNPEEIIKPLSTLMCTQQSAEIISTVQQVGGRRFSLRKQAASGSFSKITH